MKIELLETEDAEKIMLFGFRITSPNGVFECCDLCTDRARIEKLYRLLQKEQPDIKIIPELVEDYIFTPNK